jgi:hypothetical protein
VRGTAHLTPRSTADAERGDRKQPGVGWKHRRTRGKGYEVKRAAERRVLSDRTGEV